LPPALFPRLKLLVPILPQGCLLSAGKVAAVRGIIDHHPLADGSARTGLACS